MHPRQKTAYALAQEALGMKELAGPANNAEIIQMFADVGHSWVKEDAVAWCAAFVGAMLERAGLPSTRKLNARSYLDWGKEVEIENAQPGDIVVFYRGNPNGWQGHVGFFVRDLGVFIEVLGGNQSDQVSVARYAKSRLLGVRRYQAPVAAPTHPRAPVASPAPAQRLAEGFLAKLLRLFRGDA